VRYLREKIRVLRGPKRRVCAVKTIPPSRKLRQEFEEGLQGDVAGLLSR